MGNNSSTSNPSSSTMNEAIEYAKSENANNQVVIWSKSYCPYCKKTKNLMKSIGVSFKVHELDQMSNGSKIQEALANDTGQRTVPIVFVKGKHIGGNDDIHAAHASGELQQMLA